MKDIEASARVLSPEDRALLCAHLKSRFEKNPARHSQLEWTVVETRLAAKPDKAWSLSEMESSGGEPDVVGFDQTTGEIIFVDCSTETPKGRVSLCYDRAGLDSRKEHKPKSSAVDVAAEMGIDILTEDQYRALQELGAFDLKTSSWIKTPGEVRELGGALYGEWRYGRIFVGHNGAQSYYGVRGFRGMLRV